MASLLEALFQGTLDLEEIKIILQRYPSSVKEMEDGGLSSLHLVLTNRRGSAAIVKLLLHYGADPNMKLTRKGHSLSLALQCTERFSIIRALVEGGT